MDLVLREKTPKVVFHKVKTQENVENEKKIYTNSNFSDLNLKDTDIKFLAKYNYEFYINIENCIIIFIDKNKNIYFEKFEYNKLSNEFFCKLENYIKQIVQIIPKKIININFEQKYSNVMEYMYSISSLNNLFNNENIKISYSKTRLIFEKE